MSLSCWRKVFLFVRLATCRPSFVPNKASVKLELILGRSCLEPIRRRWEHGVQENRRVYRTLAVLKCDDYAASSPQRLDDARNGSNVFHLPIIDNQNKENLPFSRHKKRKSYQLKKSGLTGQQ
jgi:hypothetical protein